MQDPAERHIQNEFTRIHNERLAKLDLLAQHYGIEPNGNHYLQLALALARDFVPGFSIAKMRGAPERWPNLLRGALVVTMQDIIQPTRKGRGPTYAAKILSQRNPWKKMVHELDDPPNALLNVYKKTTKHEPRLVAFMQGSKNRHRLADGTTPGFDAMINELIDGITTK